MFLVVKEFSSFDVTENFLKGAHHCLGLGDGSLLHSQLSSLQLETSEFTICIIVSFFVVA